MEFLRKQLGVNWKRFKQLKVMMTLLHISDMKICVFYCYVRAVFDESLISNNYIEIQMKWKIYWYNVDEIFLLEVWTLCMCTINLKIVFNQRFSSYVWCTLCWYLPTAYNGCHCVAGSTRSGFTMPFRTQFNVYSVCVHCSMHIIHKPKKISTRNFKLIVEVHFVQGITHQNFV